MSARAKDALSAFAQMRGTAVVAYCCRDAMPARAKLAIIERLLPEAVSGDPSAVMIDLHMMVINGGQVRKLAEFKRLLTEANLELSKVHATSSGLSVIEAVPA